ncbi:MAG: transposition helper protein [Elusimicrobia bacterium]|nr:MAG: transposition helper protein [Elusimicrobiota bacterium]KAF0154533.1 MAG: transposition helper protein [Elusimicrobiota bacterium]
MKLYGMAQSLMGRLADARQAELTHAEFVGLLAADEQAHRDCKRLRRLLRRAHMKQDASLENIDYRRSRGLNVTSHLMEAASVPLNRGHFSESLLL